MSFTILQTEIPDRDPEISWEENAPGLYQFSREGAPCPEAVVQLDTGEKIAISVEENYRDNSVDLNLRGYARWINEDGSSQQSPDGVAVETILSAGVSLTDATNNSVAMYRAEILKLLLGEAPTMVPIVNPPGAVALSAEQEAVALEALKADGASPDAIFSQDATAIEAPLLRIPEEALHTGNIRNAISIVTAIRAPANPIELLS